MYKEMSSELMETARKTGTVNIKLSPKFATNAQAVNPNIEFVPYVACYTSNVFYTNNHPDTTALLNFYATEWAALYEVERLTLHQEMAKEERAVQEMFLDIAVDALIDRTRLLELSILAIQSSDFVLLPEILLKKGFELTKNKHSIKGRLNIVH